eukprot:UN11307
MFWLWFIYTNTNFSSISSVIIRQQASLRLLFGIILFIIFLLFLFGTHFRNFFTQPRKKYLHSILQENRHQKQRNQLRS